MRGSSLEYRKHQQEVLRINEHLHAIGLHLRFRAHDRRRYDHAHNLEIRLMPWVVICLDPADRRLGAFADKISVHRDLDDVRATYRIARYAPRRDRELDVVRVVDHLRLVGQWQTSEEIARMLGIGSSYARDVVREACARGLVVHDRRPKRNESGVGVHLRPMYRHAGA